MLESTHDLISQLLFRSILHTSPSFFLPSFPLFLSLFTRHGLSLVGTRRLAPDSASPVSLTPSAFHAHAAHERCQKASLRSSLRSPALCFETVSCFPLLSRCRVPDTLERAGAAIKNTHAPSHKAPSPACSRRNPTNACTGWSSPFLCGSLISTTSPANLSSPPMCRLLL